MLIGRKCVNFLHQMYQSTVISNEIDQFQTILQYIHVNSCRNWTICSCFSTLKHKEKPKLVHFYENYMILHVPMAKTGQILPSDVPKYFNISQNQSILTHFSS